MKKLNSITIVIILSCIYFLGSMLGYSFIFEPLGQFMTSNMALNKPTELMGNIMLSIQHFLVALIAALPVAIMMLKKFKVDKLIFIVLSTLPVVLIGGVGILNVNGGSNIFLIAKDISIIILTPLIVTYLLRKFETQRHHN